MGDVISGSSGVSDDASGISGVGELLNQTSRLVESFSWEPANIGK